MGDEKKCLGGRANLGAGAAALSTQCPLSTPMPVASVPGTHHVGEAAYPGLPCKTGLLECAFVMARVELLNVQE